MPPIPRDKSLDSMLTHDNDPNKSGHVIQKRNSQLKRAKRTLLQSC